MKSNQFTPIRRWILFVFLYLPFFLGAVDWIRSQMRVRMGIRFPGKKGIRLTRLPLLYYFFHYLRI